MDYYKKRKLSNIFLLILFIIGVILQFVGHSNTGYKYLAIQLVSLVILLVVLYLYNRRFS
ncbi:MAG: hypothetical protein SOW41_04735 [Anaerococcus sp.]|uniref:DUF6903 family protein n=1 Tax=Anaerococcus sp. TaxID=1872515 RepID=UPI002A7955FB|nr:hypothetical protein [Anaerococcus sp.]MDD7463592.1 hypothetical protein [Peptoniphilaceae bacterium]MDY3055354.1 hypothetical protein [Anaerococcus sp.]MDY6126820.1 hypothetical protein [Anaerococcus sp.]